MNESTSHRMPLPEPVIFAMERLEAAGWHAYVVGGAVRDWLMGRAPGDYDLTTDARPADMQAVFADCRVVETGLKHGTLTVVRGGMNVEITTYRIDGAYADGRHPDSVTFTDRLADDLARRDFTVNAMAYSPKTGVVDLWGGREDLKRGLVRCVGNAGDRFAEDGLRILRALRFASALGFTCEEECAEAVREGMRLLDRISRERVRVEIVKLLRGGGAADVLRDFAEVVAHTLPPLEPDSVRTAADLIAKTPPTDAVRMAVLLDSLDARQAGAVLDSLKPSREEKRAVTRLLDRRGWHDPSLSGVRRLMRDNDDDFPRDLADFLAVTGRMEEREAGRVKELRKGILARDDCRRLAQLAVDGGDLARAGYQGAAIGETLGRLLEAVLTDECPNEREELLKRLG